MAYGLNDEVREAIRQITDPVGYALERCRSQRNEALLERDRLRADMELLRGANMELRGENVRLRAEVEALRPDAERWRALEYSVEQLRVYVVPATGNSLSSVFELRQYFDYSLRGEGEK